MHAVNFENFSISKYGKNQKFQIFTVFAFLANTPQLTLPIERNRIMTRCRLLHSTSRDPSFHARAAAPVPYPLPPVWTAWLPWPSSVILVVLVFVSRVRRFQLKTFVVLVSFYLHSLYSY